MEQGEENYICKRKKLFKTEEEEEAESYYPSEE